MQPSEFWALPIADWWVEFDAKYAEGKRMEETLEHARTGGAKGGGFTAKEWADARRRHAERMKN